MRALRVAVLGAGAAGLALAGSMATRGLSVALFARSETRLAPIRDEGFLLSRFGESTKRVFLTKATTELGEALADADVIVIATNSTAHGELAAKAARFLKPEQIVLLMPGHTGGSLEFRHVMLTAGGDPGVTVAEAQALPFVCRSQGDASVVIYQEKRRVRVGWLAGRMETRLLELLHGMLPNLEASAGVLTVGFDNMTSVIQPCLMVFSAARIEQGDSFRIYRDGLSPSVARTMQALDNERLTAAAAYGIRAQGAADWLEESYAALGADIHESLLNTAGYAEIRAPASLNHRFLMEHIPMGVVPIAALGALAGRPVTLMNAMIDVASSLVNVDLRASGRTLARLGLAGLTVPEILRAANHPVLAS